MVDIQHVYVVFSNDPSDGDISAEPWAAYPNREEAEAFCTRADLFTGNIREVKVSPPDSALQETYIEMNRTGSVLRHNIQYTQELDDAVHFSGQFAYAHDAPHARMWHSLTLRLYVPGNSLQIATMRAHKLRKILIMARVWPRDQYITIDEYADAMEQSVSVMEGRGIRFIPGRTNRHRKVG